MTVIINHHLMVCQPLREHLLVDLDDYSVMDTKTSMAERVSDLIGQDSLPQAVAKIQLAGGKVTVQAVHKWKHGGEISEANLAAFAKAYGSTPAWIRYGVSTAHLSKAQEAAARLLAVRPDLVIEAFDFAKYRLDKLSNVNSETAKECAELIELVRRNAA